MATPVKLEYRGKIAVITIDNVEKLNALDQDGYYELASFMREVAEHDEVFVTVLIGKGMFKYLPESMLHC
jgi:peroxisomal 3,2-trans-enoyl-CoA isomerase